MMGGVEEVAVVRVCVSVTFVCTCVYAAVSECHQGRRPMVVLCCGGTCITFIDTPS